MTYVFMLFAVVGAGFLFEIGRTLAKVVMEDWGVRKWLTQKQQRRCQIKSGFNSIHWKF